MNADIRQYINIISEAADETHIRRLNEPLTGADERELWLDTFMQLSNPPSFYPEIREALETICGELINQGNFRQVWTHRTDPELVVKLDGMGKGFFNGSWYYSSIAENNVSEAGVWQKVRNTGLAQWFAPVVSTSPDSWVLCQRSADQDGGKADPALFPAEMPLFFAIDEADALKLENWGEVDGRPVCLDYGQLKQLEPQELSPIRIVGGEIEFPEHGR